MVCLLERVRRHRQELRASPFPRWIMGQDGPSTKRQVEWDRFLRELGAEIPVLQDFAGEEAMGIHGAGLGPWRMEQVTFTRLYYNLTIGFSGISSVRWPSTEVWRLDAAQIAGSNGCLGQSSKDSKWFPSAGSGARVLDLDVWLTTDYFMNLLTLRQLTSSSQQYPDRCEGPSPTLGNPRWRVNRSQRSVFARFAHDQQISKIGRV